MKLRIGIFLTSAILATSGAHASAATRPHSQTIVVESPSALPILAIHNGEAMYLHTAEDGRVFLYVETEGGSSVSVLDVSDPSRIRALAKVPASTQGAFDFVQDIGDEEALVRFRGTSQVALLNLAKATHPAMMELPLPEEAGGAEALGRTGLLVTTSKSPAFFAPNPQTFYVMDTASASRPALLAKIPAVKQRLAQQDTGTTYLLNRDGVTVIRRPRAEQAARDAETYTN